MSEVKRVVVVDDSPFVCRVLKAHLQSAPDIEVVATAVTGEEALARIRELNPDVVTLDLEMPGLNGFDILERIMREMPTPVLIVTGTRQVNDKKHEAIEKGAVEFLSKTSREEEDAGTLRREIVQKVRQVAQIKVIRSLASSPPEPVEGVDNSTAAAPPGRDEPLNHLVPHRLLVIGSSTGGPPALLELLNGLPRGFTAAIVVVQHLPALFTQALAAQLRRRVGLPCQEASDGDSLTTGTVHVAPGDRHLLIRRDGRLEVQEGPKVDGYRPSINVTMQSVAEVYGRRAWGVILTGMGNDGARGLKSIRQSGGRTFVQDPASCVVASMPNEAIAAEAVDVVSTPAGIANFIMREV